MLNVLSNILCDLDPKVKVIGQKAGICDGVPSTSALVFLNTRLKFVWVEALVKNDEPIFIFYWFLLHVISTHQYAQHRLHLKAKCIEKSLLFS